MNALETAVSPALLLKVDGNNYTVSFPLSAVAQLEEAIGRPMRTPQAWLGLPAKDVQAVLKAGLQRVQGEEVAQKLAVQICDGLNPEAMCEVLYALTKLAFPKFMEELEKRTKAKSPNAPSGDGTSN